jgi:hypothetical protein
MPELQFDYSSWFVIVCLLIAAGYAFTLYSKKHSWSKNMNIILTILRFVVVTIVLLLLLNPLLKQLINKVEKPIVVLAVDNSISITNSIDSINRLNILDQLTQMKTNIENNGFEIVLRDLTSERTNLSDLKFDQKTTDLNAMFKEVETLFDGKNLASLILVSDGNYNRGISPIFFSYGFKISTVGIGDTTSYKDVILKNVLYNKIAYQGNKFPIVAEITNTGFQNQEAMVNVKKGSNTIASEKITFGSENGLSRVEFNIDATNNGVQHYSIEVTLPEEEIIENNSKQIFIDVIDGKQKILLLGLAPHPDIKALRSVIEINENYEFELFIPGFNELKEDKYDLIMVHQAGDRYNRLAQYTKKFRDENVPILNIIGQQTNLDNLSKEDNLFSFKSIRNQRDQISPALFSEFSKFKVDSEFMDIFNQYPTLNVPYGENNLAPNATVLIYQKVGNIATNKPLLYLVESGETKSAYLMADGIWQWRLQEFASKESTKAFDDVFLKLVQYLSTKEDKRKFRVYTTKEEFFDNETVSFEAEVYNDSYERIFGNDVSIKVTDENGATEEYSFIPSSANSKLEISGITQGVYKYEATTKRNDQPERVLGQFTVKNLLLELLDRRANFSLLRQLAENAEGQFYTMQRLNEISSDLKELNSKGIMQSNEEFLAIINLKWLFFLILILLSIEWFTRKYSGAY